MKRRMTLLVLVLIALVLSACGDGLSRSEREKIGVVQAWEAACNEGDYEAAAQYLSEDVTFITPPGGAVVGRDKWLETAQNDNNPAKFESENFQVVNEDHVTWDTVVYTDAFIAHARIQATVVDGQITYYLATER